MDPLFDQTMDTLQQQEVGLDHMSIKMMQPKLAGNLSLINEARSSEFGTIVVGRRGIAFVEEFFVHQDYQHIQI